MDIISSIVQYRFIIPPIYIIYVLLLFMPIAFHMGSNGSIWVNRRAAQPEDQCALGQSSQELPFT